MLEVSFTIREPERGLRGGAIVLGEKKAVVNKIKDLTGFGMRLIILNKPC